MNNAATALLRIAALAGGAVIGAFLARWVDEFMASQSQEQVDSDKLRYAQGLAPLAPQSAAETSNIYTIDAINHDEDIF